MFLTEIEMLMVLIAIVSFWPRRGGGDVQSYNKSVSGLGRSRVLELYMVITVMLTGVIPSRNIHISGHKM